MQRPLEACIFVSHLLQAFHQSPDACIWTCICVHFHVQKNPQSPDHLVTANPVQKEIQLERGARYTALLSPNTNIPVFALHTLCMLVDEIIVRLELLNLLAFSLVLCLQGFQCVLRCLEPCSCSLHACKRASAQASIRECVRVSVGQRGFSTNPCFASNV